MEEPGSQVASVGTAEKVLWTVPPNERQRACSSRESEGGFDLRSQRQQLFQTDPPPYNRRFLQSRLAYRLQELAFGGLKPETVKLLDPLPFANEAGAGDRLVIGAVPPLGDVAAVKPLAHGLEATW